MRGVFRGDLDFVSTDTRFYRICLDVLGVIRSNCDSASCFDFSSVKYLFLN